MKRSAQIALAGATALAAAGGASMFRSSPRAVTSAVPLTAEAVPDIVAAEVEYENDFEVPGVGFYHAPYHAWFPRKWNDYDPAQGYFHGGSWSPMAEISDVTRSKPTGEAAFAANALYKQAVIEAQAQQPGVAGGNSFHGGGVSHYRSGAGWHSPLWRSSGTSGGSSSWGSPSGGGTVAGHATPSSSGFKSSSFGTTRGGFGSSASSHSGSSSS